MDGFSVGTCGGFENQFHPRMNAVFEESQVCMMPEGTVKVCIIFGWYDLCGTGRHECDTWIAWRFP
jgi:hypothetical protein